MRTDATSAYGAGICFLTSFQRASTDGSLERAAGREWRPKGQTVATRTHDFPGDSAGSFIPTGVYDMTINAGWVNVGTDDDTAAFAVESIRRWWNAIGQTGYPAASRR